MAGERENTIEVVLEAFLADQRERLADSTYATYEDMIGMLRDCLDDYGHLDLDDAQRRRFQAAYDAGDEEAFTHLFGPTFIVQGYGQFLDYFLVRKVGGGKQLFRDASTVTKKLARWLGDHGHLDDDQTEIAIMHASEAAENWRMSDW